MQDLITWEQAYEDEELKIKPQAIRQLVYEGKIQGVAMNHNMYYSRTLLLYYKSKANILLKAHPVR